jgi:hypothetical protein
VDVVESTEPSGGWSEWKEFQQLLVEKMYWPTQEPMPLARIKMLSLDAFPWDPDNPDYVPKGAESWVENYENYLKGQKEEVDLAIRRQMARSRRKVLLTSRGLFGVASHLVKAGDHLYLLPGAEFPMLLRRYASEVVQHEFVGECYIHGLMDSQGMVMDRKIGDSPYGFTAGDDSWLSRLKEKKICLGLEEIVIG